MSTTPEQIQTTIAVGPLKLDSKLHADLQSLAREHERSLMGEVRFGLKRYRDVLIRQRG